MLGTTIDQIGVRKVSRGTERVGFLTIKQLTEQMKTRLVEIRPYFKFIDSQYNQNYATLNFKNTGGQAENVQTKKEGEDSVEINKLEKHTSIDEESLLSITVPNMVDFDITQKQFEFSIIFQNTDGNQNWQKIRKVQTHKCEVEEPKIMVHFLPKILKSLI